MAVKDEGPGIAPEAAQKIFDAFYTTRAGGAGIGLAVVRRIIDDHKTLGASIEVRGAPERGATFVVQLARADGRARKQRDRDAAVAVPANAGSRS
jgi:signal transduction histidine kinase